jgi:glucose-6-phosphate 1-dehydrogenase
MRSISAGASWTPSSTIGPTTPGRIPLYEAASWGPVQADELLARDNRSWNNDLTGVFPAATG